jgi:hypothetical protein
MKTNALYKVVALAASFPLIALAESPGDTAPTKQGVSATKDALESSAEATAQNGIARKSDAVYIYRAGQPQKVETTTTVSDGLVVEPSGRVMWTNGKEVMLTEGQMVGFDGTLLKEPKAASPDRDAIQGSSGARN